MKRGSIISRCLVVSFLFSVCVLSAQSLRASPPIVGVTIQAWNYDKAKAELSIRLVNTSQKDITGYTVSVQTSAASGAKRNFSVSWDLMGPIARNEKDAAFHPGGYEDRTISINSPPANPTTVDDVHVVLVVYGDETAQAEDEKTLAAFSAARADSASAMRQVAAAVQGAIDNPADNNPSATALKAVQALATVASTSSGAVVFEEAINNLKQARSFVKLATPPISERDWLRESMVKRITQEADALAPHTKIRRQQ